MKRLFKRFLSTRDKNIERLILTSGETYEPAKINDLTPDGFLKNECTINHLGGGRYLVGYHDSYKSGTWGYGLRINRYVILYPPLINEVIFK